MTDQSAIVFVKRDTDEGTTANLPLWMLVEYRHRNKVTNCEVVAAKDVCTGGGNRLSPNFESMHTGKLVYIKKDSGVVQATVVAISDDKEFLNDELKVMVVKMQKEEYEMQNSKKRKRISMPKLENGASTSQQYVRWNGTHEAGTSTQNGIMNKQSVIKTNPNVQNYPPMTFDQQTQTDFKVNNVNDLAGNEMRFTKILATEENISRDVHTLTEENHEMKQQVADLRIEVAEIKSLLKDLSERLIHQQEMAMHTDFNRSMLNSTPSVVARPPHVNPPRILNLSHQSNYTPHTLNYNSISIEPVIEASTDSNFSYSNHSRVSLSASNQSIYQSDANHNDSTHVAVMKHDYSNSSKSSKSSKNGESYPEDEGDPNEEVVIGVNGTTITRNILINVNWNSHTAATRRLLRTKFTREVLASHSLTGKPSPAFIESSKPTKNQLNPKIIADIVHYVAKRCKVTETAVRSSITTKCADENKMMRQRADKTRKALMKLENKENVGN
ncbi:protein insensitive-like [Contarinia nasturtii]|uniref:protein insensitive-like n=1 Tax=Contarinia nasturtii TaxID=265458 RepID=UPI0012D3CF70|nr:protein insensitive-like [Contarinia nasturtii]XP_031631494.1 protein insensitive-like [Contarinia nasturtii]